MSLLPIFLWAQNSTGQSPIKQEIEKHTVHQTLYELRTQKTLPAFDSGLSNSIESVNLYQFSPDTSWSYDERTESNPNIFIPSSFAQTFDVGTELAFNRLNYSYNWEPDSLLWLLSRKQEEWINDDFIDSVRGVYYSPDGEVTYGDHSHYLREPSQGATSELFMKTYDADLGWQKQSRSLTYQNEDHTETWSKNYRYNTATAEYDLTRESWYEHNEEHYLYESKSYTNGVLSYWNKRFSLFNSAGNTVFSTSYSLNTSGDGLAPTDSTSYVYHATFAEALGFNWVTDSWILSLYSRTYESPATTTSGTKVDSALSYSVIYDADLDSLIAGEVINKTVWVYDANDHMIESTTYTLHNGELIPYNKTTHEYEWVDGFYHPIVNNSYTFSWGTESLYLYSQWQTLLNEENEFAGDLNFYFSEQGDTLSGYKSMMYFEKETMYSFNYEWNTDFHAFVNTGFSMHLEAEPVTQFSFIHPEYGSDRSIHVLDGLPATVNPGPLFLALDDTLDLTLRAWNPDRTIPVLSAQNLPATATFDPVTRRLFWVVDEVSEDPILITTTNGDKQTALEIKLVFGEFTVSTELESERPLEVMLYQNYPNPFNPSTTLSFELSKPSVVSLQVFNVLGQPVQTLLDKQTLTAGLKQLPFHAGSLSSGIYYYRLEASEQLVIGKMTLIK